MKGRQRFLTIFTLGLLSALGPFSIDMYLPGFPSIAADLNTTVAHVALSLSSYFIGISIGQLFYGPLLDRFGRKIPLYVGLCIYLAASIWSVFVHTADTLIIARFVQAIGGCAGMVAARALVRDLFPVSENAKVFSLLMLVIAVSPIVAPTVGGYMTSIFGWHSIFIVLSIIVLINILTVYAWLPAGRPPDTKKSLMPGPIIKSFWEVFKVPQFYTYTLTGSFAASGLYAYIAGSPYIFMELYGVSEKEYGWLFGFIALGLISASQLNTVLLRKHSSEQITKVTLICQVITGSLLLGGAYFHLLGLYSTILLAFLFLSTQGFAFPNTSALSIAPFSKNAGTASALMGAIQLGIGAGTTAIVSILSNHSELPMTGVMFGCAFTSLMILLIGRMIIRKKEMVEEAPVRYGLSAES